MVLKVFPFDPLELLDSEEAIASYLKSAAEAGDAGYLRRAYARAAQARERNARRSGERVNAPA